MPIRGTHNKNLHTHVKVLMRTIHRRLVASAPDCNMRWLLQLARLQQLQALLSAQ
jgi:hypothetical protein